MTIVDVTKDNECCCSCTHNKRAFDKDYHCTCTCELDVHFIGYVANFGSVCEEWEGERHERSNSVYSRNGGDGHNVVHQ